MKVFEELQEKFSENLNKSLKSHKDLLEEAELKAKVIFSLGELINSEVESKTHKEISQIFNEMFSDLTISIYLASCSINTASKTIIRRVLELGIGLLYFWDLQFKFWAWKENLNHESDLSFKESLDHLGSKAYADFLRNELNITDWQIDKEKINKLYRSLSNTIHGKYVTFETISEKSFEFNSEDYQAILSEIIRCENILISCIRIRFNAQYEELRMKHMPSIDRFKYTD